MTRPAWASRNESDPAPRSGLGWTTRLGQTRAASLAAGSVAGVAEDTFTPPGPSPVRSGGGPSPKVVSGRTNSKAPRSAYATGPIPPLSTSGSSKRAWPSASVAGQSGSDVLALSIAGESRRRWKSAVAGSTKRGSLWSVRVSCPLAAA